MSPRLVRDAELLWVLDAKAPALTSDIETALPIARNSVYVRLHSLERRGDVTGEGLEDKSHQPSRWELTDRGRAELADADLPPAPDTDFEDFFAGRSARIEPTMLLKQLAAHEDDSGDEWVPSTALYDLPFSKNGIRQNLHSLREEGLVAHKETKPGNTNYWRVTEQGYEQLSERTDAESTQA